MSLSSARLRAVSQPQEEFQAVDASLLCTEKGCRRPWTTTFFGRLCSEHEAALTGRGWVRRPRPVPLPSTPPVAHWQDEQEGA